MYCVFCGKKIDDDSKFCPFCGLRVARNNLNNGESNGSVSNAQKEESLTPSHADVNSGGDVGNRNSDIPIFDVPQNDTPTFNAPQNDTPVFNTSENDIPTFKAPKNDIPVFSVPSFDGPACHYHTDEPAVGRCARCGKSLCQDCCDSYGVVAGEYAGKNLCYDCTQELITDNINQLNKNLRKIKSQFILQLIGMAIGFFIGIGAGLGVALVLACMGGMFLRAVKAFVPLACDYLKNALQGNLLAAVFGMVKMAILILKCIGITVIQTIQYVNYIKKTSGFIESDTKALEQIKEYMQYTLVRQQNRGVNLEDLMKEGSQLYNNSFAQMVREQGEEKAEAYMSQCVTRIAENGEIIRDFPKAA